MVGRLLLVTSVVLAALVLSETDVLGARYSLPVERVEWVTGPTGGSRALLYFGELSAVAGKVATSAHIKVTPASGVALDAELSMHTVTTDWAAGTPTWTYPWTTPGGDRGDKFSTIMSAGVAALPMSFDVTSAVQLVVEGVGPSYGFMLCPGEVGRVGFSGVEKQVIGNLQTATLEVRTANARAAGEAGRHIVKAGRRFAKDPVDKPR